jgi:hypothetical protein
MTIYDETGEYETIECPICHVDVDSSCDHVLAFADVTFTETLSGVIEDHCHVFRQIVTESFAKKRASGNLAKWKNFTVDQMWGALLDDEFDPKDFGLPAKLFHEFIFDLLSEAGGWEHPGTLIMGSGSSCESVVRILYAADPLKVVADALELLPSQLVDAVPKVSKRRRDQ